MDIDISEIIKAIKDGKSVSEISKNLNISKSHVMKIKNEWCPDINIDPQDVQFLLSQKCPISVIALILDTSLDDVINATLQPVISEQDKIKESFQDVKVPLSESYRYGEIKAKHYAESFAKVDTKRIKREIFLSNEWRKIRGKKG